MSEQARTLAERYATDPFARALIHEWLRGWADGYREACSAHELEAPPIDELDELRRLRALAMGLLRAPRGGCDGHVDPA